MSQVFPATWLSLDASVRAVLARELGIRPTGQRSVVSANGVIRTVSDGFTAHDLLGITVEKLKAYVEEPTIDDGHILWIMAVAKAGGTPVTQTVVASTSVTEPEAKKPVGRPRKIV